MIIGKVKKNKKDQIKFITGKTKIYSTELDLECILSAGNYIALIDIDYDLDKIINREPFNAFVFSTYTET